MHSSLRRERWRPLAAATETGAAVSLARDLARRLADADFVDQVVADVRRQTEGLPSVAWIPFSIAQGDAGLGLFFGCLDACLPGEGWERIAHSAIERAARAVEHHGDPALGLYAGVSSLAFAVLSLSRGGRRYRKLLLSLEAYLLPALEKVVARLTAQERDFAESQWDLISGLTGIGAYLLARLETRADLAGSLSAILASLVCLSEEDDDLPRWHTPGHLVANPDMRADHPHGHLNCGLAHGCAGPLALLALAALHGVRVEGMDRAMARLATTLRAARVDDAWGINWPSVLPLRAQGGRPRVDYPGGTAGPAKHAPPPTHAAWCYGSPGVARALWLSGVARDDPADRELALEAMHAIARRPASARRLHSATFCHGVAGLLAITLRFRDDAPDPILEQLARELLQEILGMHDPEAPLGFRAVESDGRRVDQVGLLDGAPGVSMVLLAAATDVTPTWDRLFLLS
jgi:lantibiotic modifying enzyme